MHIEAPSNNVVDFPLRPVIELSFFNCASSTYCAMIDRFTIFFRCYHFINIYVSTMSALVLKHTVLDVIYEMVEAVGELNPLKVLVLGNQFMSSLMLVGRSFIIQSPLLFSSSIYSSTIIDSACF